MGSTEFERWLADLFGKSTEQMSQLLENPTAVQFLVTWSIFEYRCFEQSMKVGKIQPFVKCCIDNRFDEFSIVEYAKHFHQRYKQNKRLYKHLLFDGKSAPLKLTCNQLPEIDSILKLTFEDLNTTQILTFSIFVAYRFRNNIFHGTKGVNSWLEFKEQIDHCTNIMQRLISHAEEISTQLKDV